MKATTNSVRFDEQPDGMWRASCLKCSWHRDFATIQGAVTRFGEHSLIRHKIRRIWTDAAEVIKEVSGESHNETTR